MKYTEAYPLTTKALFADYGVKPDDARSSCLKPVNALRRALGLPEATGSDEVHNTMQECEAALSLLMITPTGAK